MTIEQKIINKYGQEVFEFVEKQAEKYARRNYGYPTKFQMTWKELRYSFLIKFLYSRSRGQEQIQPLAFKF